MLIDYISNLERAAKLCEEFENDVEYLFFNKGKEKESSIANFCWSEPYRRRFSPIKACVQLCQILKLECLTDWESVFLDKVSELELVSRTRKLEDFKFNLEGIKLGLEKAQNDILAFCSAFDEEEKRRMNEAIHDYLEGCNYSCVAMSVSAAESRLLKLMCLANPDSKRELEQKTLGQLIFEYDANKEKYRNVVPKKHEPLLDLCNTYRTFSVHPKKQKIKPMIASSILNLTIEFLTDQDTKPEVVQAQLIAGGEGK